LATDHELKRRWLGIIGQPMSTEMNGKGVLEAGEPSMSAAADNTGQKQQIGRPFEPGESGNPAGRPKGSRNRLSEAFLQALANDFEVNGREVIKKVRTERPHDYLKVCASVMPKRLENEDVTEHKDVRDMTDAELEAIIWRSHLAAGEPLTDDEIAAAERRLADNPMRWRRRNRSPQG
jgi:hypothetical protein